MPIHGLPGTLGIVVMGGDLGDKGSCLGPESKMTCLAAGQLYREHVARGRDVKLLCSPGMAPRGYPQQTRRMAELQWDLLLEIGVPYGDIIVAVRDLWSSRAEIRYAVEVLPQHGVTEVIVVSKWYHLPRLDLLWGWEERAMHRPDPRVPGRFPFERRELRAVPGGLNGFLWELIKLPNEIRRQWFGNGSLPNAKLV